MRLRRFTSSGVHKYAYFDVRFDDRLTFLTGINGSGKTTILNAILALITPDLAALQQLDYDYLRLDVTDESGQPNWINARRADNGNVEMSVKSSNEVFAFAPFIADPSLPLSRQTEAELEHSREVLARSARHPVVEFIASLPTPMFLGLDRRSRLGPDDRRFAVGLRVRVPSMRSVFRTSLAASLNEASELAQSAYRDARLSAGRIGERLQQQLILSLLSLSPEDYGAISVPTEEEKQNLQRIENDLEEFPKIFRLPKAEVMKRIKPFVATMQKALRAIPDNADVNTYFREHNHTPEYFTDVVKWSANKSQLKRIGVISELVAEYNQQQSVELQPITHYKELVNAFVKDSGKSIEFADDGTVEVRISGLEDGRPLSSLSSGEAQIFVMLTNLAFNPNAQRANVFIIDEPELSLHVRWQELFVDSMMSANEKTQFIMATHSPSIILDRLRYCVDVISKRKPIKHG